MTTFDPSLTNKSKEFLRNLDATIASFSDSHVSVEGGMPPIWGGNGMNRDIKIEIEDDILKKYSPAGLEDPFKQLYSILFPALYQTPINCPSHVRNSKNHSVSKSSTYETQKPVTVSSPAQTMMPSSSAAILMGVKGSGKSLLLERVLGACREQLRYSGRRLYRMVEINGIVCRGEDVASVVYEIIRQLSGVAYRSIRKTKISTSPSKSMMVNNCTISPDPKEMYENTAPSKSVNQYEPLFQNRKNFGEDRNGIESFDDSHEDQRKTIIVHEDEKKKTRKRKRRHRRRKQRKIEKRMLRLRHATFNSNLSLMESILKLAALDGVPILLNIDELDSFTDEGERQMLLYHFLDRVATPGSNLILVAMTSSFAALTLLEKRIRSRAEGSAKIIYLRTPSTYHILLHLLGNKMKACAVRKDLLERIPHPKDAESVPNELTSKRQSYTKGTVATDNGENYETIMKLSNAMEREFRFGRDIRWFGRVVATALTLYRHDCIVEMSRNIGDAVENNAISDFPLPFCSKYIWNAMTMTGASVLENMVLFEQSDSCMIDDVVGNPRLHALSNLSQPEVAILLSARRILKRELHRDQAVLAPLTMERMLNEYKSFSRRSISMGTSKLLKQAVCHLMQQGLLIPSIDHSGGGPLHYDITKIYKDLDHYTLFRLPLHAPFDMDRELGTALDKNLLGCSTALKEWGKSITKGS